MKKITLKTLALFGFFISANAFAQPAIEWSDTYGGSGQEYPACVKAVSGGNYVVAGWTSSSNAPVTGNHGLFDAWVVKVNASGGLVWQKALGGSDMDEANFIQETADGGYIVAASTSSNNGDVTGNHGGGDAWIIKLSAEGSIVWQKFLGGSGDDFSSSIQQTADGGYIVVGGTSSNDGDVSGNHGESDIWIVKLDATGTIQWQKCVGGSLGEFGTDIRQAADGGYFVSGSSKSIDGDLTANNGDWDCWVVKLDTTGAIQWQKSLGGSAIETADTLALTASGGCIIAGSVSSNDGDVSGIHGSNDFWVVNLDASGQVIWQKCLGSSSPDRATSIMQLPDGGFIVAGTTMGNDGDVTGFHGGEDYWVVKLNNEGNVQWQKAMGGSAQDQAFSIDRAADGGLIVAGATYSVDGDITGVSGMINDFWVVKLTAEPLAVKDFLTDAISVYPNPGNGTFTIKSAIDLSGPTAVKLYSVAGRHVYSTEINAAGPVDTQVTTGNLVPGMYVLQVDNGGKLYSKKVIIE